MNTGVAFVFIIGIIACNAASTRESPAFENVKNDVSNNAGTSGNIRHRRAPLGLTDAVALSFLPQLFGGKPQKGVAGIPSIVGDSKIKPQVTEAIKSSGDTAKVDGGNLMGDVKDAVNGLMGKSSTDESAAPKAAAVESEDAKENADAALNTGGDLTGNWLNDVKGAVDGIFGKKSSDDQPETTAEEVASKEVEAAEQAAEDKEEADKEVETQAVDIASEKEEETANAAEETADAAQKEEGGIKEWLDGVKGQIGSLFGKKNDQPETTAEEVASKEVEAAEQAAENKEEADEEVENQDVDIASEKVEETPIADETTAEAAKKEEGGIKDWLDGVKGQIDSVFGKKKADEVVENQDVDIASEKEEETPIADEATAEAAKKQVDDFQGFFDSLKGQLDGLFGKNKTVENTGDQAVDIGSQEANDAAAEIQKLVAADPDNLPANSAKVEDQNADAASGDEKQNADAAKKGDEFNNWLNGIKGSLSGLFGKKNAKEEAKNESDISTQEVKTPGAGVTGDSEGDTSDEDEDALSQAGDISTQDVEAQDAQTVESSENEEDKEKDANGILGENGLINDAGKKVDETLKKVGQASGCLTKGITGKGGIEGSVGKIVNKAAKEVGKNTTQILSHILGKNGFFGEIATVVEKVLKRNGLGRSKPALLGLILKIVGEVFYELSSIAGNVA